MTASAAAVFSEQVQTLELAMQSRFSDHLAQIRKEISKDILSFRQGALANVIAEKKKMGEPQEKHARPPTVEVAPDAFALTLLEPAMAVRVNGRVLHVHVQVLRRIPYFAAFLAGEWQDHGMPQVDLPCSFEEFGLLLRRLYTGEILGSSKLPIESCASAIRVASAAGMLLIDQQLHELRNLLVASVKSAEDMEFAKAAQATFPESLADVFDVCTTVVVPDDIVSMVSKSKSDHARKCADRILQACRGRFDSSMLIPQVAKLLEQSTDNDLLWAQMLMQNHMSCNDATLSIQQSGASWSSSCNNGFCVAHRESLQTIVGNHVVRCANEGSLKAVFKLGTQRIEHCRPKRACLCRLNYSELPLLCFGEECAGSVAQALLEMPHELGDFAAMMANMAPWQIRSLVTDEVLSCLGANAKPVLTSLAANSDQAIRWCSIARLQILPFTLRRSFCYKLISVLDHASPEVAEAIAQALC